MDTLAPGYRSLLQAVYDSLDLDVDDPGLPGRAADALGVLRTALRDTVSDDDLAPLADLLRATNRLTARRARAVADTDHPQLTSIQRWMVTETLSFLEAAFKTPSGTDGDAMVRWLAEHTPDISSNYRPTDSGARLAFLFGYSADTMRQLLWVIAGLTGSDAEPLLNNSWTTKGSAWFTDIWAGWTELDDTPTENEGKRQ